jgi:hypothetical protein
MQSLKWIGTVGPQDEYQKWSCEDKGIGWTDGPLEGAVGLSDVSRNQDREVLRRGLTTGWTDGGSNGSSDGFEDRNRKVLARNPSAPDEPTIDRGASIYVSDEWRQQSYNGYTT